MNLKMKKRIPRVLESNVQVRFQDCDPFGHLNNANFIPYFFNAREDQLKKYYGFDIQAYSRESGFGWVVYQTQISYLVPALLDEKVIIKTRLIKADKNKLIVEGLMLDKQRRRLKALIWAEFRHVNTKSGRPTSHPKDFYDFAISIEYQKYEYSPDDFSKRIKEVKAEVKKEFHKSEKKKDGQTERAKKPKKEQKVA